MHLKEQGFKKVNGINLYYEIYGDGKPLILVHGGGSSGYFDFKETIERLSGRFQLITIDLQNHGRSEHRNIPQTFELDARDVVAVVEALGINKASFFGFSNGATTVLEIANLFPEKTEKIIAASAVTKRSGMIAGFFEGMAQATIDNMPQYLKDNFLKITPDPVKMQNMFDKDSQRMIHFIDWNDDVLRAIKSSVFFIGGDKDVMTAQHMADMHNLVPHSQLMILPAEHGTYMMADGNGNVEEELIAFTISQVKKFLQS